MFKLNSLLTTLALCGTAQMALAASSPELVEFQTNLGTIGIEPDYFRAPISANNFMTYVDNGFYTNTLIHRVARNSYYQIIQGGGFDKNTGAFKTTLPPIVNESTNGLSNRQWTVGMARTDRPNTATSQFFINTVDNLLFDYSSPSSPGYAVFATVTKGRNIVQQIGNLATNHEVPFSTVSNLVNINGVPFTSVSNLVYIEAVYKTPHIQPNVAITRIRINGSGRVVSDPAGINCGSTCTSTRTIGGSIKLTATPSANYSFAGWSGDCQGLRTIMYVNTQHGNHNCTAIFKPAAPLTQ